MIIRSQNKTRITDDLKLHIFIHDYKSTDECYEIQTFLGATIGEYSSMEKAIKVLDMIQDAYLSCNREYLMDNFGFVQNKVFEMPQDCEVQA